MFTRITRSLFFFTATATTKIYTLSLHDALPIYDSVCGDRARAGSREEAVKERRDRRPRVARGHPDDDPRRRDRKSTRLNSSHGYISYAVFCLKKKKYRRS